MQFGVIYEANLADPQRPDEINLYAPDERNGWTCTEGEDGSADDLLHHRKWIALLSREQFDEFVEDMCLYPEDVEGAGALGMPVPPDGSMNLHTAPTVLFTRTIVRGIKSRYGKRAVGRISAVVTPYPDVKKRPLEERDWKRIRRAVLNHYY